MTRTLFVLLPALLCAFALAVEFQPIGFESIGMGGAGVANARGSMAGYYNPALLAASPDLVEVNLGGGFGVREYNLANNIDRLAELDLTGAVQRIAANAPLGPNSAQDRANIQEAQAILTQMGNQRNTLGIMPTFTAAAQVRNIAIGAFMTSDAGAQGVVDPARTALIVDGGGGNYYSYNPVTDTYGLSNAATYNATSLEFALNNNLTYMKLDGLAVLEVPVSYARRLPIPVGTLAVGVSAKAMRGITYRADVKIDTESGDIEDQLENNDKTSSTIGVDVGALYIPPVARNVRVGIIGKNLNSPKFERVGAPDVEISPMWRAGVAMDVGKQVGFAADLDLTKNDRFDGTESQFIGGGVNYHPNGSLSFRLGAMKNLANSDDGLIGTLGIGIGLKALQLDLAVQAATKSGEYDGRSIPRYARANLALVSRW
ncbi:MAG: hypothetical protein BWY76_02668 [bacterium ADurb.Bin429]|nr:MAG: hypothetical protein BWY76_02668 [bacterium ADurb.Bin429]